MKKLVWGHGEVRFGLLKCCPYVIGPMKELGEGTVLWQVKN